MTRREPIHQLPAHYHEIRSIRLTEDRLLLRLNLLAAIPLALMIIWMALWWIVVLTLRAPEVGVELPWWLTVIVCFAGVLPLHEAVHGIVIAYYGHRVRYGANLSKGVLYATADDALFRRNEYLAVALAPFVGITLGVMGLMLVLPQGLAYVAATAAVLNAGGAIGDLWSVGVLMRCPANVLVRDQADGFRIYAPDDSAAGSSTQNSDPPSGS